LTAIIAIPLLGGGLGTAAIATDSLGAGHLYQRVVAKVDRLLAGPAGDPSTTPVIDVTSPPATPAWSPTLSPAPVPTPSPTPSATPIPRVAVNVDIVANHATVFAHELKKTWCAPAGVAMVLAILGKGAPTAARQKEIAARAKLWQSYRDSHDGGWGPSAMAAALDAYGAKGYTVQAYPTRAAALVGAARAIATTNSPVILLTWRGAHTWIMSGYRATADPLVFADATVSGTYILDPWYPWKSSLWGQSDPPGTFQSPAEMVRNFLPWVRPEGTYPERDGKFIIVVPTIRRA